jgi:hypothetical protein
MPLAVEADAVLNLYSGRSNGFSEEDVSTAEAFAAQAAGSLGLVLRVNDRLRYQVHLRRAADRHLL